MASNEEKDVLFKNVFFFISYDHVYVSRGPTSICDTCKTIERNRKVCVVASEPTLKNLVVNRFHK